MSEFENGGEFENLEIWKWGNGEIRLLDYQAVRL
jgi:hypothetical protein